MLRTVALPAGPCPAGLVAARRRLPRRCDSRCRARGQRVYARGSVHEALQVLTDASRQSDHPHALELLVRMRHEGFGRLERSAPPPMTPVHAVAGPAAPLGDLTANELSPTSLRAGLARNGCVLVRGLVPPSMVEQLVAGIDATFDAFDRAMDGSPVADTTPWYVPFEPGAGEYRVGGRRNWVRKGGAIWTADSPRMLFDLFEMLDALGIGRLVTEYLGERPALSANKSTLRRTTPAERCGDWHQDGAFLGADVRSLNVWLSLAHAAATPPASTSCPGVSIGSSKPERMARTSTGRSAMTWRPRSRARRQSRGRSSVPVTCCSSTTCFCTEPRAAPEMTRERHAMETWLFAPSTYPEGQIPLVY